MLTPRSLQSEYTLIYSGDPALQIPADAAAAELAFRVARETGKWDALIKSGEQPTLFHVRPIPGTSWTWFLGEFNRRSLVQLEAAELALRLALRGVANLGEHKVKLAERDGHEIAAREAFDLLYSLGDGELGRGVVSELGSIVIQHAHEGIGPLR